jgi:hypothetical protein
VGVERGKVLNRARVADRRGLLPPLSTSSIVLSDALAIDIECAKASHRRPVACRCGLLVKLPRLFIVFRDTTDI